jgi:hypothetical protein
MVQSRRIADEVEVSDGPPVDELDDLEVRRRDDRIARNRQRTDRERAQQRPIDRMPIYSTVHELNVHVTVKLTRVEKAALMRLHARLSREQNRKIAISDILRPVIEPFLRDCVRNHPAESS